MGTLHNLIVNSARAGRTMLDETSGMMPAGHNGPYHDPETPLRNTGHWLITFAKAYELTNEDEFLTAVEQTAEYLTQSEHRPSEATFRHRSAENKDQCNGLIGQAWTIEALAVAAETLDKPELYELAEEVFCSHPFDEQIYFWERIDVDGTNLSFDRTFNHQLWFAAAGGLLADENDEIKRQVRGFLEQVDRTMRTYESGLIRHPLDPKVRLSLYVRHPAKYRGLMRSRVLGMFQPPNRKNALRSKARAYHGFNLYAFAVLKEQFPKADIWDSPVFNRTIDYVQNETFRKQVDSSNLSFSFNPVGFEIAYALETFDAADRSVRREWVQRQLTESFDGDSLLMTRDAEDPNTLAARLYEATRLENYDDLEI